jgi:hypothetical protein
MSDDISILRGFVPERDFVAANKISIRTSKRYRAQRGGMPFVLWGGKVFIPVEPARAWLRSRMNREKKHA